MSLTQVSTGGIKDGSILDADISSSTTISGSKLDLSSVAVDFNDVTLTGDTRVANGLIVSKPVFSAAIYGTFQDTPASIGHAAFLSIDGTKVYVVDTFGDKVIQVDLSAPWSFSGTTIPSSSEFVVSSQDTAPYGLYISPDGSNLYVIGQFNGKVNRYSLATPWEITTATFVNDYSVGTGDAYAVTFSSDGTKFYTLNSTGSTVKRFNLATAWDVTTASNSGSTLTLTSGARDFHFSIDGRFFVAVYSSSVRFYELATPWDITTAAFLSDYSISSQTTGGYGVYIRADGSQFFVYGSDTDYIYSYSVPLINETITYGPATFNGEVKIGAGLEVYGEAEISRISGVSADLSGNLTAGSLIPTSSTVPTNGVYLPAANSVGLSTGGSGRLFVTSAGSVGIGTSAPFRRMEISATNAQMALLSANTGASELYFSDTDSNIIGSLSYSHSTDSLAFNVNATERLRITSAGLVGIGTSSPSNQLTVQGASGQLRVSNGTDTVDLGTSGSSAYLGSNTNVPLYFYTNNTTRMYITSAGNVGIGTTSVSGGQLVINSTLDASNKQLVLRDATNGWARKIGVDSSNNMAFYDGDTERLRIANTGALGLSGANYGSSGQVLTSQGSGAAPQWATPGGGAWQFISSITANNSASVAFTSGIDSTYDVYMITGATIRASSNRVICYSRMSTNFGASYVSSNSYATSNVNSSPIIDQAQLETGVDVGSATTDRFGFICIYYGLSYSSSKKVGHVQSSYTFEGLGNAYGAHQVRGLFANISDPINAIQFYMSSGSIASGTFRLYGLKNS